MENHSSNRAERRRRGAWDSAPTTQRQGELFWLAFGVPARLAYQAGCAHRASTQRVPPSPLRCGRPVCKSHLFISLALLR
jgi:hypothetical protein